jgi:hypothetical protein
LTTSRKYVSAVIEACRIKVCASATIYLLPEKTAILTAPQAWGKSSKAESLREQFGCHSVVDEWNARQPLVPGALHLSNWGAT